MGCILAIICVAIGAALLALFGPALWVLIVIAVITLGCLTVVIFGGHRGFGGGGNTDLMMFVAAIGIAAAIAIPQFSKSHLNEIALPELQAAYERFV